MRNAAEAMKQVNGRLATAARLSVAVPQLPLEQTLLLLGLFVQLFRSAAVALFAAHRCVADKAR